MTKPDTRTTTVNLERVPTRTLVIEVFRRLDAAATPREHAEIAQKIAELGLSVERLADGLEVRP